MFTGSPCNNWEASCRVVSPGTRKRMSVVLKEFPVVLQPARTRDPEIKKARTSRIAREKSIESLTRTNLGTSRCMKCLALLAASDPPKDAVHAFIHGMSTLRKCLHPYTNLHRNL